MPSIFQHLGTEVATVGRTRGDVRRAAVSRAVDPLQAGPRPRLNSSDFDENDAEIAIFPKAQI